MCHHCGEHILSSWVVGILYVPAVGYCMPHKVFSGDGLLGQIPRIAGLFAQYQVFQFAIVKACGGYTGQ